MDIGRRIYYELSTGNVLVNTGERSGDVQPTTIDQDFHNWEILTGLVRENVGVIELEFGEFAQDFLECNGYRVNVETKELLFSYPDPEDPEAPPVFQKPLSVEVKELRQQLDLVQTALDDLIFSTGGGL